MKKIFLLSVLGLGVMFSKAQVQTLKAVNYRGAFAPSPTAMWTNGWTNWDPQNTSYPSSTGSATRTINSAITTNTVWSKDTVYLLQGLVYVTNNATLTVQAGTVIHGDATAANSSLVITRGAKLMAIGTVSQPIVFTSNKAAGSRAPGDWGGVILLGKASYNGAGGISNIEGIDPITETTYGGGSTPDDNDNSGTLKYVRIEFGGYVFQPNKEINGLTFGAVGRGTTIDYVQCSFINDDAFEWFGGTVNCSHLVSYRGVDDEFDTDNGFSGTCQFLLGVRDPNIGDPTYSVSGGSFSEGFESDNDANGTANTPLTKAVFSNVTFVGPLRGDASSTIYPAFRRSARIRRNSNLRVVNSLLLDYPTGLFIDGAAASANATAGTLLFANNLVAGNATGKVLEKNTASFDIYSWFAANNNDSSVSTSGILVRPYDFTNPDYRPATSSPALSNYSFSNQYIAPLVIVEAANKNFVQPVDFRGAFGPSPTAMWTNGWTNWDPQNTTYATPTVTVSTSITTNTTWTKNNTYLLQGLIYVSNNATLTIEPGTVIRGDASVANTSLIITRGAKLIANGTVSQPIVFTSSKAAGSRVPGDWGGVILLGKASYNGAGGISNIEGIDPITETTYGGGNTPDDNDNSGSLKYVRIEFGGYVFQPNKEINGLTFGAVGRGTTIDYVQCSFINDDAFEWFGGTVNCSHLVSYRGVDDEFDTDNGYSGTCQFLLGVRDPQIGDPTYNISGGSFSEGFESDNDANGTANTPLTKALFTNVTFVGPLRGNASSTIYPAFRRSARLRRNTNLRVLNSLLLDYPTGLFIDGAAASANATSGALRFSNNLVAGNATGKVLEKNTASFDIYSWFAANKNDSLVSTSGILVRPYNFTNPDYRPAVGSPALVNYNFTDSVFNGLLNPSPCATPVIGDIVGAACLPSTTTATSTYSIDSVTGASYAWTVPTGVTIVSGQGTKTLVIKAATTIVAIKGNLSVSVTNGCGSSALATLALGKNGAVGKVAAVIGSTDPCDGIGTGYSLIYKANSATNASGYAWTSVGGTVLSTSDTTATIRFNKIAAGSVTVTPYSTCGTDTLWGIVKGLNVKTALPTASGVVGNADGCAGIGAGNSVNYTALTATNATTYIWTAPTAATLVSGQGTTAVSVSLPDNFTVGALAVKAGRVCGTDTFFSAPKSLTLKTLLPVKPTAIISASSIGNDPCARLGNSETFSIAPTANSTGALWSTTGVGDSVVSSTTSSAVVGFATNFRVGAVAVKAQRTCGSTTFSSAPISLALKVALPAKPTAIISTNSIGNDPCARLGNSETFSVAPTANSTGSIWSTTGVGSTVVSSAGYAGEIGFTTSFRVGGVVVAAQRTCGSATISSAAITLPLKVALPTVPVISGNTTPCRNTTNVYSASASNKTSFNWSVATGLSLGTVAGDSAYVTTGATYVKAGITVASVRACGTTNIVSASKILNLVRPASGCPVGSSAINELVSVDVAQKLAEEATIYPNPSNGAFKVNIQTKSTAATATIQVVNIYGQVVKTYIAANNAGRVYLQVANTNLSTGIYLVKYVIGDVTGSLKLSINK